MRKVHGKLIKLIVYNPRPRVMSSASLPIFLGGSGISGLGRKRTLAGASNDWFGTLGCRTFWPSERFVHPEYLLGLPSVGQPMEERMRKCVEDQADYEFYDGRAALEREMARTARDETFAAMHALLSKRYQDMAVTIGRRGRMDGLPAQHADKFNANSTGRSGA